MAIIYTYTKKSSVAAADTFIISDSADDNKTKTVTAQEIANYVDGEVTLQEVLDTGNTANNQSITLTGAPASISSSTVTATTSATLANVTHSSSNILSSADLTIANTTGLLTLTGPNDINVTSTLGDVNVSGIDFTGTYTNDYQVKGGNTIEMYTTGGSPTTTVGEIALLAQGDLNLLSNSVINIGQSGTGQPESISFNTSGPAAPGNAITFFVATSGNDIQFPNNAYLKLLGAVKDSNSAVAPGANHFLSSDGVGKVVWKDEAEITPSKLIEEVQFASAVDKGTAVYISGPAHGSGRPTVDIADSTKGNADFPVVGLANASYSAGAGEMIITGILDDFDVTTIAGAGVGDILYLDPSVTTVNLTATKPTSINNVIQNVAIVTKAGANGQLQVNAIGRVNDLPNNNPNALFTANVSGHPVSTTGVIDVDVVNQLTTISQKYEIKGLSPYGTNNNIIGSESGTLIGGTGTANANVYIGKLAAGSAGAANPNSDNSSFNVAIGNQTLAGNNVNATTPLKNTSSRNIAIGHQALSQPGGGGGPATASLGEGNIAIGYQTAQSLYNAGGGEGASNVVIGNTAGFNLTLANHSTLIGANAGGALADGTGNTCVGYNSKVRNAGDERAVAVGYNAEAESLGIALGAEAAAGVSQLNINVSGAPNPPRGGLPSTTAAGGPYPPAGVGNGDVYVIEQVDMGNLGGVPGQLVNILAIV